MKDAEELRRFAHEACLPYLINLERFKPWLERLSFMLVGSVATGLCDDSSDVDIAIVCEQSVYARISCGTDWDRGRPTETCLDGVQLQYYGIAFETIQAKLAELDDACLYVYSHALPLQDPQDQYSQRLAPLVAANPGIRKQRIEGKLDMLIRRARALRCAVETRDIMSIAGVCLELIRRSLMIAALMDNVPFDPRKRLFSTAVRGALGRRLEPQFRRLLSAVGELGNARGPEDLARFTFPRQFDDLLALLSGKAKKQGFRVGLDRPDVRQV